MKTHYEYLLEKAGFEQAGPDVWAKLIDEVTAFIELTTTGVSTWLWHSEKETYAGPRVDIDGNHDKAVAEAFLQLQGLLGEESACGSLPKTMLRSVEQATVQ